MKSVFISAGILLLTVVVPGFEATKCGTNFRLKKSTPAVITQPRYSKTGPTYIHTCNYRITAPVGYRVKLTFTKLQLAEHPYGDNKCTTSLELIDGSKKYKGYCVLDKLKKRHKGGNFYSSGRSVTISMVGFELQSNEYFTVTARTYGTYLGRKACSVKNLKLVGRTIKTMPVDGLEMCSSSCDLSKPCEAWNYHKSKSCTHLSGLTSLFSKISTGGLSSASGYTSGIVRGRVGVNPFKGLDFTQGVQYREHPGVSSFASCRRKCAQDPYEYRKFQTYMAGTKVCYCVLTLIKAKDWDGKKAVQSGLKSLSRVSLKGSTNIQTFTKTNSGDCNNRCWKNSRCNAWTHEKRTGKAFGTCYLKGAFLKVQEEASNIIASSGILRDRLSYAMPLFGLNAVGGRILKEKRVASPEDCDKLCNSYGTRCVNWVAYVGKGSTNSYLCKLKSSSFTAIKVDGYSVLGGKTCRIIPK